MNLIAPPIRGERLAEARPKIITMPRNARTIPTTSSLRSSDRLSQSERAGGGGGGRCCLPFEAGLPCDASPFLGGRVFPAGVVVFLGGVDGFRRGGSYLQ